MSKLKTIFLLSVFLYATNAYSQVLPAGPQVLSFFSDVDDTEQPYALYIPENYTPSKKYPLVVMLHGAGSNHRLGLRRVFGKSNQNGETDVEASRYFPQWKAQNYIVAAVYARGTMGYQGVAEQDVLDMMADVNRRFSIDENRTYLTGLSMGGGGTVNLGLKYADKWAAIAPVCPAVPFGTKVFSANALNVPVHVFQGGADPVVPAKDVQAWVATLKAAGAQVAYQEYPGVQHDSWVNAYKDGGVFDWLGQYERNPYPNQVKFGTDSYNYTSAYWVQLTNLLTGANNSIDAVFKKTNQLSVQTENIQSFTLHLEKHPQFQQNKKLKIRIDGQILKSENLSTINLFKANKKWTIAIPASAPTSKRKGAEGPMSAAIASRHIYVYGTGGEPSKQVLEQRKQQAEKAANWAFYRGEFLGRIKIYPRVLSDKEVRPSDLKAANLILFGDKETNGIIAQHAAQLPIHLPSTSKDMGLAYIFPVGERYMLINSGLSILEAPDSDKAMDGLSRYVSTPISFALGKFKDVVLFTKEEILLNERFDGQWKLKEEAKKVLETAGVQ